MKEERMLILDLVDQGKISVTEAIEIIEYINADDQNPPCVPETDKAEAEITLNLVLA
jgi:hypothetical protein